MRLPFELDPQIIHHIIYSQAGSIGKAIIELLMNSVDARASAVHLSLSRTGFTCSDDGQGFARREDVVRYFGRFGTPHDEGDATYGRFRLGRGQIMAHATTVWRSNAWMMTVDTRAMGYHYDLDELHDASPGCSISGDWYEVLSDAELMSTIQEVRDLVRYTPVSVELNGQRITRDPRTERWDAEDECAWYRVKADGAVSIYNQGVLVRHDPAHTWGAGGLIVSKKAIGLNVSRTEILRKTCPVWKSIARQFGHMADQMASRLGDHRKTEARREKSARALLSGDANIVQIYSWEEVVTLLPGKRHVSLEGFLRKCRYSHNQRQGGRFAVVDNVFDVPKGEAIAREGIVVIVHPTTLDRFGCYNAQDFVDCIIRIQGNLKQDVEQNGTQYGWLNGFYVPDLLSFSTLRDAFIERTRIVTEKDALDRETRRAWTALRWCLHHYAALCTGGRSAYVGQVRDGKSLHILLGQSNIAQAWTDGSSYIAVDVTLVKRLKSSPLRTAAYIFTLIEHEVAHEGDSLDCGHDEAFYQRFHDLALQHSEQRQRYMHMWLMKYTMSLEGEGRRARGEVWRERFLVDRAGSDREKRGLPPTIEDVTNDPVVVGAIPGENMAFIDYQNTRLVGAGTSPAPADWTEVLSRAEADQKHIAAQLLAASAKRAAAQRQQDEDEDETAYWAENDAFEKAQTEAEEAARRRFATLFNVQVEEVHPDALCYLMREDLSADQLHALWTAKPWEADDQEHSGDDEFEDCDLKFADLPDDPQGASRGGPTAHFSEDLQALIRPRETAWTLERNAAAAGFCCVGDYLKWREEPDA
ncbi:ATP-binding protein [Pseudomonas sp. PAMC 29040]|uniref:ATP-binding protein n=1 Tax=Pseudomonas sp. PAMC 29040 TaxID=2498450 RepID=UPI000FB2C030|nr:ATP-binding protein [Pseudomonas sp. PAMC 29040]RUT42296.1 ATP-binding protein [Pseudomonas sp. PAMC 29040]